MSRVSIGDIALKPLRWFLKSHRVKDQNRQIMSESNPNKSHQAWSSKACSTSSTTEYTSTIKTEKLTCEVNVVPSPPRHMNATYSKPPSCRVSLCRNKKHNNNDTNKTAKRIESGRIRIRVRFPSVGDGDLLSAVTFSLVPLIFDLVLKNRMHSVSQTRKTLWIRTIE